MLYLRMNIFEKFLKHNGSCLYKIQICTSSTHHFIHVLGGLDHVTIFLSPHRKRHSYRSCRASFNPPLSSAS